MTRSYEGAVWLALAVLVGGCDLFAPEVPCEVDANCPASFRCAAAGFCRPAELPGGPRFDSRMRIDIGATPFGETLVDFPLLVRPPASVPDDSHLGFFDATGASLPFEIERWAGPDARAIWVLVPELPDDDDDLHVWLHFGAGGPPASSAPTDVWRNGFLGVWHLGERPSTSQRALDSTGNGLDATPSGLFDDDSVADAVAGAGLRFDGTQGLAVTAGDLLRSEQARSELVVEAWVQLTDDADASRSFVGRMGGDGERGFDLNVEIYPVGGGFERGLSFRSSEDGGGTEYTGYPLLDADRWYHAAGAYSVAGGYRRLFLDGALDTTEESTSLAPLFNTTAPLTIGKKANDTDFLVGWLDEVRLSGVARSEAWMAASYAFVVEDRLDYGPVEPLP